VVDQARGPADEDRLRAEAGQDLRAHDAELRRLRLAAGARAALDRSAARHRRRRRPGGTPLLEARRISKRYGLVQALLDVEFAIGTGEIVGLAGENGSGKSTLAKILAGALVPDGGEVLVEGTPRAFQAPREALDAGIALVSQEPTVCPSLTVAENLLLTRLPKALSPFRRRRYNERARPLLELIDVDVDPGARFDSLRAGDRELVEIGKALAAEPRVLILDESTSRLGERDVARLFNVLRGLRERGTSIVFITHRLPEFVEFADRAVVLRDGRNVGELSREDLSEERLAAMMVGRTLTGYYHKPQVDRGPPLLHVDQLLVAGAREPVSFTVHAGEVVGLAGLVGAGRTELLETIFGVRRPRAGRVLVAGEEIPAGSPKTALELGIALVPEERHRQGLNMAGSVRENITMGTWSLLLARRRLERSASQHLLERLRIRTAGIEAPIRSLSGGNQQKVVIARCLIHEPRVLLLDEPTRGIDVGAKAEVFALMAELLRQGLAIVLVSSEMLEILGLSDRIIVLHEQAVAGELSRADATEEEIAFLSAGGGRRQDAAA
jgi:ABC-type sugar transport system ATPase subunit